MKRKETEPDDANPASSPVATPKRRRAERVTHTVPDDTALSETPSVANTPSKTDALKTPTTKRKADALLREALGAENSVTTPKTTRKLNFTTPKKKETPSRRKAADKSAKKKSARALLQQDGDEDWEGGDQLAQEILDDEEEERQDGDRITQSVEAEAEAATPAPVKRRGRPKGAKNFRSPTPEGDIPPHERYFFQNRPGPVQTSNNTLNSIKLLTHEEYFDNLREYKDPHKKSREWLLSLHTRAFPQWEFELEEDFNICLYGYGSKRKLVLEFAEFVLSNEENPPTVVVVNGYVPTTTLRSILTTLTSAIFGQTNPPALATFGATPSEILTSLGNHLLENPPEVPFLVLLNSIDASPLRRQPRLTQSFLAQLASTKHIHLLATADTANFQLLWDVSLRTQFNFVFHEATTFEPYDAEIGANIGVVDDVHELIGRKSRRIGGKEGVNFVLKSLPENARNLYRVILTEALTMLAEFGGDGGMMNETVNNDDSDDEERGQRRGAEGGLAEEEVGLDFHMLYQKAVEEFICSSEMSFRQLLKEFHDHQMIISKRDGTGGELLGVPLSQEEMEGVLEDLVLG